MNRRPINKDKLESMCRNAGMIPAARTKVRDFDLFIADGFSLPPHRAFRRFGLEADDFPFGCYVTLWWLMKDADRLWNGGMAAFDAFHDPEYDVVTKRQARINAAIKEATAKADELTETVH